MARSPARPVDTGPRRPRRRPPDARAEDFVAKAVEFFAEVGFEGGTRELAQRLGVSQPLLYRYFPSKDELIRAVYQKIYLDRWDPAWDDLLTAEMPDLRTRLQSFYESYTDRIFTRDWLRIYLFAGLRGVEINRWYVRTVEDLVLKRIARGLRRELGLDPETPISPEELELLWTLQGGIFYYGVRRHIYGTPVLEDKAQMIATALEVFLAGAERVIRRAMPDRDTASPSLEGEAGQASGMPTHPLQSATVPQEPPWRA